METASEFFIEDDITPVELQKLWARRLTSGHVLEAPLLKESLYSTEQENIKPSVADSELTTETFLEWDEEDERENELHLSSASVPQMCLDAGYIGDFPVRYVIPSLPNHEFPVVGLFIDPRIVPGFKYKVRVLPDMENFKYKTDYLFGGKALKLESIGRGYCHRLTFEPDKHTTLNDNDNYFWSDSRDGFAFELEVVNVGDKFTVFDANDIVVGALEIKTIQAPQEEVSHIIRKEGGIDKTVRIKALCKMEWYDDTETSVLVPIRGLAVCTKQKNCKSASISKVFQVTIGNHQHRRGFTLTPGVETKWRRTTVHGANINDIPIKYIITGLQSYELPVIGSYVDRLIVPGYSYKVRVLGNNNYLFEGKALNLNSVGIGYGKRITFESDSLNEPNNFFWSDSNPDGYGFEIRAVESNIKFKVLSQGQLLGQAKVFRADAPQVEVRQEVVNGTVMKYVSVDLTCHVSLTFDTDEDNNDWQVMRVSGIALVAKQPKQKKAEIVKIENIGLDSQLNLVFTRAREELTFIPM